MEDIEEMEGIEDIEEMEGIEDIEEMEGIQDIEEQEAATPPSSSQSSIVEGVSEVAADDDGHRSMVVRKVTMTNFRSFNQEAVLENLGPGLHVIVGENGAGKSNILSAINLAISNDLQKLHERERKELISSFTNRNNRSATFAVWFDNAFKSLPGPTEFQFCQTVGKNSNKLLVNGAQPDLGGKTLNIFNLINPLYYVKQGEITGFVLLADEQRLSVVKEITSYSVWEGEKEKIMQEVKLYEERVKTLEASLVTIEEELKQHRKDLEEIHRFNARKIELDVLSYLLTFREYKKDAAKLDSLLPKLQGLCSATEALGMEVRALEKELGDRKLELDVLTRSKSDKECQRSFLLANIEGCIARKQIIKNEQKELLDQKAQLEALQVGSSNIPKDLKRLEKTIKTAYKKFLDARSKQNSAFSVLANVHAQVKFFKEQIRRKNIGLDPAFRAEKREELGKVKEEQRNITGRHREAEDAFNELEDRVNALIVQIKQTVNLLESNRNAGEVLKIELCTLRAQRNQLHSKQVVNWDAKCKQQRKLVDIKEKYERLENILKLVGGKLYKSCPFVGKIISDFEQSADPEDKLAAKSYYGVLLENITGVDPEFAMAVEVAAGRKLFYHVVLTIRAGMRILKEFNRRKYPGELVFLAEDTVTDPPPIPGNVIARTRADRLLPYFQFNAAARHAILNTFGNYLVVRDIKNVHADKHVKVTFISLDGDILKSNGPITGGYRDPSRSIISCQLEATEVATMKDALHKSFARTLEEELRIRLELKTLDENINALQVKLDKNSADTHKMSMKCGQLMIELMTSENAQADVFVRATMLFEKDETLKASIHQMEEDLEANFKGPEPSTDRDRDLEAQTNELATAKEKHKLETQERKSNHKELLEMKVKRRILLSRLCGDSCTIDKRPLPQITARIECADGDLQAVNETMAGQSKLLKKLENRQGTENARVKTLEAEIEKLTVDLSDKSGLQSTAKTDMQIASLGRLTISSKLTLKKQDLATLQEKGINHVMARTRFPQYVGMGTMDLYATLVEVTDRHTKSPPTNLRAVDTNDQLKTKKVGTVTSLAIARKELSDSADALEQITEIGPRAFMWILKNIQFSFRSIYDEIIGASSRAHRDGTANFALYSATREFGHLDSHCGPEGEDATYWADEKFIGAKLEIITRNGRRHHIRTLSGGQRTVLALAFILAIQQNSPTRLFLFDEIDQALDKEYTRGVVKVLKRFCEKEGAQFFCTTFNKDFVNEGDKIFHVTHTGNTSRVAKIGVEAAVKLPFLGTNYEYMRQIAAAQAAEAASDSTDSASGAD